MCFQPELKSVQLPFIIYRIHNCYWPPSTSHSRKPLDPSPSLSDDDHTFYGQNVNSRKECEIGSIELVTWLNAIWSHLFLVKPPLAQKQCDIGGLVFQNHLPLAYTQHIKRGIISAVRLISDSLLQIPKEHKAPLCSYCTLNSWSSLNVDPPRMVWCQFNPPYSVVTHSSQQSWITSATVNYNGRLDRYRSFQWLIVDHTTWQN